MVVGEKGIKEMMGDTRRRELMISMMERREPESGIQILSLLLYIGSRVSLDIGS